MSHILAVHLQSETCFSGAGGGRTGDVDTDIEVDPVTSLPILRGRILKGLLVEEAATILHAFEPAGEGPWHAEAERVFGVPRRACAAALHFGDGRLPEDVEAEARSGIAPPQRWTKGEVLDALTVVRTQTRVAETGAPDRGSLRRTRLLRAGLCFRSAILGASSLSPRGKALVAASVAAVRRAGLHRNHGWGAVRLRLLDDRACDVTDSWVALLESPEDAPVASPAATVTPPTSRPRTEETGRSVLIYRLRLTTPLVLADVGGDPSTVETLPHISGGSVLGALAQRWTSRQPGTTDAALDPEFRRLFLDGSARWLHAYPAHDGRRLLPCPESLAVRKEDLEKEPPWQAVDRVLSPQWEAEALWKRPPDTEYVIFENGSARSLAVRRGVRLHHVRDREAGRPLQAGLFSYVALQSGQEFVGHVLCEDVALATRVGELLRTGPLSLGRSRTATYGGWATVEAAEIEEDGAGWSEAPRSGAESPGSAAPEEGIADGGPVCVVTLISDALGRSKDGQADPASIIEEISAALGLPRPSRAFLSHRRVAGYVGVWKMPRPSQPALKAGSVIVFAGTAPDAGRVRELLWNGVGERRTEGFGRVAVAWPRSRTMELRPLAPAAPVPSAPKEVSADRQLFRRRLTETVLRRVLVASAAEDALNVRGSLSPSLVARLRSRVRTASGIHSVKAFLDDVAGKKAGKSLAACRFGDQPLDAWLRAWMDGGWIERRPAQEALARLRAGMDSSPPLERLDQPSRWRLIQCHLDALFERLRRRAQEASAVVAERFV